MFPERAGLLMIVRTKQPVKIERRYARAIKKIVRAMNRRVAREIRPHLAAALREMKNDAAIDEIDAAFDRINAGFDAVFYETARTAVFAVLDKLDDRFSFRQTPLVYSDHINTFVRSALIVNARGVSDLAEAHSRRIRNAVYDGIIAGLTTTEIGKQLQKATTITLRGAELLARNQISTVNGKISLMAMGEAGVKKYIWRTARDERVRGNPSGIWPNGRPSHYKREGKQYDIKKGAGPRDRHPGLGPLCRCYQEYIL